MNPVILLIITVLLGPLSILVPAILEDYFTSGANGDSTWFFIGPILYGYGLIAMVFITSVTYVFLMLVGATGIIVTTARTLFILELVAFVVVTAALAIHILLGGE